ncbi:MAG: linear amide C-N hydrolase [Ruminococcaceae bacterium]|nr:linear amide C-N hydrolase [Oscillospiraceae bacterium]
MKRSKKIILAVVCVLLVVVGGLLIAFQGVLRTLLNVEPDPVNGIYTIDYAADYKLDQLLEEGGAENEEELVQYILRIMLKGLPIPVQYEIPELACSTFFAETPEGGYIMGRNLDNQKTDLAVVRTNPKDGYSSVSVVNLSFLSYSETLTPEKFLNRLNTVATPFFPLDGVNEKGLAVGVLQLQAPPTHQDNGKADIGTTLAIRILLDKAATVEEALDLLASYDMHASANGCYHLQISDATGNSVVVSYVGNEMIVTEKENGIIAATNFYLHDVPFEYEKQGEDRYAVLKQTLTEKNAILSREEGMDLLQSVSFEGTPPDEEGRVYCTQWSSVYDLTNPTLYMCVDQKYDTVYTYPVIE